MKAIRIHEFGGPSVLKLEETQLPSPGPNDVVVLIKAAGINPVDVYIREGKYGPRTFPLTPGIDGSGVIDKVGARVTSFKPGDRVYVNGSLSGTYAEQALCTASQVHPLPSSLSFQQGAAVGVPYVTAHFALIRRGSAQAGETVLIHGASGGVGSAAIQIAKGIGLRVIATAGTPKGRELVLAQGADIAVDHSAANYMDHILELTKNAGVNVIIEMLANVNLGHDLRLLAKFGRVVVVGNRGTVEIDPRELMSRNASILGMSSFNISPEELAAIHKTLGDGFEKKALKPIAEREFALAQAMEAQETVMKPGAHGKIVLIP
jgi:NADPH2:quinone reductase